MTIKSQGPLSMTEIAEEASASVQAPVALGSRKLRNLARIFYSFTRIAYSDFYGKTGFTFKNGQFADGALATNAQGQAVMPGWIIYKEQVKMNGLSSVLGFPTPNDVSYNPPGNTDGDNSPSFPQPGYTSYNYDAELTSDLPPGSEFPTKSLRLFGLGITSSFGVVHGPYAVSSSSVPLEEGDEVAFWWKAQGGTDAYDIFAYLINIRTGVVIELANRTGESTSASTPWIKESRIITAAQASPDWQTGDYKFVFVSGSYDASGGQWTGASLYVTNIAVKKWFEFLDEEYVAGLD